MPLPSKKFSEWNKDDLEALVAESPAKESARLDFKADCKILSEVEDEKEKARRDILVDISAMANGVGGALIIGVRQTGKPDQPPFAEKIEGIENSNVEDLKKAIDDRVNTHLDVRPAPLEYHVIPYEDDRSVVIIEIPANTYSLSMVTYKQINQFWIRKGTNNRLMTTDEIEYRFAQFAKVRDSATEELNKIHEKLVIRVCTSIVYTNISVVWFAGVPISRARDHIPVKVREIQSILEESSYFKAHPERKKKGTFTPQAYSQYLKPSLRGLKCDLGGNILGIRRDGVFVFARTLPQQPCNPYPVDGLPVYYIGHIYEPILSSLYAFYDIQEHFGIGKIALVQSGIIKDNEDMIHISEEEEEIPQWELKEKGRDIPFDLILLDEHWKPDKVFYEWAKQLGNAVGSENPIPCDGFSFPKPVSD